MPSDVTHQVYHTFAELYRHRHALFISLLKYNNNSIYDGGKVFKAWWTKEHHPENDPMFDDMILVGIDFPWGSVQYHLPVDYISVVDAYAFEIPHGPYYDGLDSPDAAVKRLEQFIGYEATKWQDSGNSQVP